MGQEKNLTSMNNFNDQAKGEKAQTPSEKSQNNDGAPEMPGDNKPNVSNVKKSEQELNDERNDAGGLGRNNDADMSGR